MNDNPIISRQVKTPADAAAMLRAALPKEQREERVFVLPLDGNGKVLAKPILVSVGHADGTAAARRCFPRPHHPRKRCHFCFPV